MYEQTNAACLSVLVLVESQGVGAVLVVVDAVLALLAQLEVVVEGALHHHFLGAARADAGDVTLCIYNKDLGREKVRRIVYHLQKL